MPSETARVAAASSNVSRPRRDVTLYGEIVGELPARAGVLATWLSAAAIHAVAHAGMALAAGGLAHAVATGAPLAAVGALAFPEMTPARIALFGLAAAAIKAASGYHLAYAERLATGHVVQRARLRTADQLLSAGARDTAPGALARVATRTGELGEALRRGPLAAVRATVQLIPLAVCLVLLSPKLALVAAAVMSTFAAVSSRARRRFRRSSGKAQENAESLHGEVNELVANVSLWRTYGAGRRVRDAIERAGEVASRAAARVAANRAALSGANEVLAALALTIAIGLGATEAGGELLAFATVFFMAYRPLRDLGDARGWTSQGEAALAALSTVGGAPRAADRKRAEHTWSRTEPLALVDFGARRSAVTHTARIEAGRVVLLRGPTGSGKTTLLLALLGLEPSNGTLAYGSQDLGEAGVGPAERPFAWVPQDAPLVTAGLVENVALAARDETSARDALAATGAAALQREIGDDPIGPGGRPLSGGQRRLVSVARAVATGLPVLLLDEPTEGLDPMAASQVLSAVERLRGERTVVIASHRPEVAALADQVIEVEHSRALAAE